jgi:hypothetical protein
MMETGQKDTGASWNNLNTEKIIAIVNEHIE